jgi:IstB-like ATP binding protein
MLTHPTLDLLHSLGLHGMAKGFKDLDAQSEARSLEHAEWLALLLEHEKTLRQQKRFESRARAAKLRHTACVEDVDYRAIRGLDRALFLKLAAGDWIRARHNLLVTGQCGVGKSCSRSSRTDMKLARSSSPASCPSTAGTKSSEIPPSPTQSSIASSTTPTASNSKDRASESKSNPLPINRSLDLLIPQRHHQIDPCD